MKTIKQLFVGIIAIAFFFGCSNNQKKLNENAKDSIQVLNDIEETNDLEQKNQLKVIVSESKEVQKSYYELPHIKEFYDWQGMSFTPPPDMTYPEDLTTLTYGDLRLLRNEVFARNGYLFNDGFLRGYFNRQKWYMPIFDVDTFKIILSKEEQDLINKILIEEKKRKSSKTIVKDNLHIYNSDLVVNKKQFSDVPPKILKDFNDQNFSIVAANRSMPFYVYDKNAYQYIPHYITTDLYLFILHKYFSRFLEKLDENFMREELISILKASKEELVKLKEKKTNSDFVPVIEWAETYCSMPLFALGESTLEAPSEYQSIFLDETKKIDDNSGKPSFIRNKLVNYSELKPRGHYTKSEKLKQYFKGFKWISLNGIDTDDKLQLSGMVLFAYVIKNNEKLYAKYKRYVQTIEHLAGQEDNLSLVDVMAALPDKSIDKILSDQNLNAIRAKLQSSNKERIKKVFGESFQTDERFKTRLFFLSSTYSLSGEIFSKLVHVDMEKSKRPFPRGLDVPAVFGDKTAQSILIDEFKDNVSWPDFLPRLKELQDQFREFDNWDHNYGFKGVQTALSSYAEKENYPDFMKTDAYNRKELSTALSSWTHIKHDLILYQEKPFAAECGQGGGPEPPQHYSYVEPNVIFWDTALELVDWLKNLSKYDDTFDSELKSIKDLGKLLKNVAYKQINKEEVTKEEYNKLHYVGGTIEYILLGLLETDHLPEREKSMALIADVYVYNGENLNVAVGHADDIYVVVPFKEEYYIARGSVFSYYEFKGKIYNDEEWRKKIYNKQELERPKWINPLINEIKPLEGQMQFRYPGHGM